MDYLFNIISILLIFAYGGFRVRLGKITEQSLTRYLIINLIFGFISTIITIYQMESVGTFFLFYIFIETLLVSVKFATISIFRTSKLAYADLKQNLMKSVRISKEGSSYKVVLRWWPMRIYLFLENTYKSLLIFSYKTMDYLHNYIPIIPGNHDKVSGIPKRWVNETVAKMHKSAKKEKIELQIIQVYFQEDLIDFTILVTPKKTRNWLKSFETEFVKSTKITNCYVRRISTRPPTLQIIIPRSEIS